MRRKAQSIAAVTAILLAGVALLAAMQDRGDPSLWIEDFDALEAGLAGGYANLEWSAERRQLDLARLSRATEEKLRRTSSRRNARRIIEDLIGQFGDPHLRAQAAAPPAASDSAGGTWSGPPATATAREALRAFGYQRGHYDFGVDFESLTGFDVLPAEGNPFPAGVLALEDGRRLGVLRIQYFGEDRYYDVAAATWETFRGSLDGSCDGRCWWRFTLEVRARLLGLLQARLEQLEGAGIEALLVDITGNGGGSEWCEDVARLFTTKELRLPASQFIKHPHWEREIEREIGRLQKDLGRPELSPELRTMLEASLVEHRALLEEVSAGCDASALWEGGSLDCQRLASDPHGRYDVPPAARGEAATLASEPILFPPVRHPDFVGAYGGPLILVIDGGTASASEQFTTLLQVHDAASVVGERSTGAGCGYTRGGIPLYLDHVGLRVWMSDCVRFRADGENELAGIEPDRIGWPAGARGKERARSLAATLNTLIP